MKKIFVTTTYPMTDEAMADIQREVKEGIGLDIQLHYYENEDDNQTAFFDTNEANEKAVVDVIHAIGDVQCWKGVPTYETDEKGFVTSHNCYE